MRASKLTQPALLRSTPYLIGAGAIALLVAAAFSPVLSAHFVDWDDNRNFTGNELYRGLGVAQLKWMWSTTLMGHYIPVTWMTLGADYLLWGMDARGYHATNLFLHIVAALLLFVIALRLFSLALPSVNTRELLKPALVSSLVFAVHPLRVESVAWVTERRDMLSLVFALLVVLAYLRFATTGSRPWYAAAIVFFVLGLLSKATIVTLPIVLAVIEWYPLGRLARGSSQARSHGWPVLSSLAPFFILSAAAGGLSLAVLHPPAQLTIAGKAAVTAYAASFYAIKTLLPVGLSPLYELPRPVVPTSLVFLAAYVVCVAGVVALWRWRSRGPAVTAIIVAATALVLPMLGIVQNGPQIAADRYTYHSAAALSLLAGTALIRWPARSLYAATTLVVACLCALTWRQARFWQDSERLWSRVLAVDSTSSVGQIAMGDIRLHQGRIEEATAHYQRGVALDPNYAEGHNNLGALLAREGRLTEAAGHYQRAIALDPRYAEAHVNWGVALSAGGEQAAAIEHFRIAKSIDPHLLNLHLAWANALLRSGSVAEALSHYELEIRSHPTNADAQLNWAIALCQAGQYRDALRHFDDALRLDPSSSLAREYRARAVEILAANGRP